MNWDGNYQMPIESLYIPSLGTVVRGARGGSKDSTMFSRTVIRDGKRGKVGMPPLPVTGMARSLI